MGTLVLASTSGAPGTTTTAIGLALAWPRSVLLVDADPGAHQAVLAGFLAGRSADGKGLLRVAEAHRDRRPLLDVVIDQSILLAEDADHERRFLPGFVRPGAAALFAGVWADLMVAFAQLGDRDVDVIVDAGRLGVQGLPTPMLDSAELIAVVMRSSLRSVVSARVNVAPLRDQVGNRGARSSLGLIVVGAGQPYGATEIAKSLQLSCVATIADDPDAAAHFSDGRPRGRKFDQTALVRSLQTSANDLAGRVERVAALVQGR